MYQREKHTFIYWFCCWKKEDRRLLLHSGKKQRDLVSPVVRSKWWENQDSLGRLPWKSSLGRSGRWRHHCWQLGSFQWEYLPPMFVLAPKKAAVLELLVPVILGLVFLSQRQGLIPLCTSRNLTSFNHVPKTKELQTIDFSVRVIDDLHGRTQHSKQPNSEFGWAQMASHLILFDTADYKDFVSGVNPYRRSCTWTCSRPP